MNIQNKKIVKCIQGSPEWHDHRANHFNASEAAAMRGISAYMTRSELLRQKATGDVPEVDEATQRRFDDGHKYEAIARPWAEEIIGADLYPVVLSAEVDGLPLSASLDGLTMLDDVAFEHKTLNQSLAESLDAGIIPAQYEPQMEQCLMISGAERCLFMASAGNRESMRFAWYESKPEVRAQVLAGWAQFAEDLANYQHTETAPVAVGKAPETLPALRIEVTGMVTASNLKEFKEHALAVFGGINTDLQTDNDFADAEKTVKWCKDVEERLEAAKQHALSQTASIDELFRTIDDIKEQARAKRLELDKLVKTRKESIRAEILMKAQQALRAHIDGINATLGRVRLPDIHTDFAGAMKGKKTVATLQGAADDALAKAKIDANQIADGIRANLKTLDEIGAKHGFLFSDLQAICTKATDDFTALVKTRIAEHDEKERQRLEAERERLRKEEEAKAQAALEAEREKIRKEEEERARKAVETERKQEEPEKPAPVAQQAAPLADIPQVSGHTTKTNEAKLMGYYTARMDEPGHVLVRMPGTDYGMTLAAAERLRDSLDKAIRQARKAA